MNDDARPDAKPPESEIAETEASAAEETLAAAAADTDDQAADGETSIMTGADGVESDDVAESGTAPKLERLQKILAQAGVASRRHAEELITEGRVQVNGKVVTELGSKADAARDHIRVDGKLLQGSERQRYYMLNKPRGFVTTVSDPEGRPTVMQFFAKSRERLYPVGRLDYLSEGLLLMTNDGALANKLTRAASGVEKTYLVKVSGEPSEEELDRLRQGVGIDREKPGSGRVHTAPAQIRRVRQGDNPWFEVVLIEGRNRELRKMFEEIGHHVEKIRRVGYGPLVLDLEPGKIRELEPQELEDLRNAAEGRLRKPKAKSHRHKSSHAQLPTVHSRPDRRPLPPQASARPAFPPRREFPQSGEGRPQRHGGRPGQRPARSSDRPAGFGSQRSGRPQFVKGSQRPERPQFGSDRPAWKKNDRDSGFSGRSHAGRSAPPHFGEKSRPVQNRRREFARPANKWPLEKRSSTKREGDRPDFKPHPRPGRGDEGSRAGRKTPRLHIEAIDANQESASRPAPGRPPFRKSGAESRPPNRPRADRPHADRPQFDRPRFDRPRFGRIGESRPASGSGRTADRKFGPGRPPRGESDRSRSFTPGTGKSRPAAGKPAWKSKPGGAGKSSSGFSRPAFGSGSKPGRFKSAPPFKGKPGGKRKQGGSRPSGNRQGGKKRG